MRDDITFHDPAENVYEDHFHFLVCDQDFERFSHLLFRRAAAYVEKIGRLAAIKFDDVHRGHGQASAVHEARDVAVQPDIAQPML